MIVRTALFAAALCMRLVAGTPHVRERDMYCVDTITTTVTVTSITTADPPTSSDPSDPPDPAADPPADPPSSITSADDPLSDPSTVTMDPTVTVTVTSTLASVSTETVSETQTVTQSQTITQTVMQTVYTQADPDPPSESTAIVTQTHIDITTITETVPASTRGPLSTGVPVSPSNKPFFQNFTQGPPFTNSSNSTDPASSSSRLSLLQVGTVAPSNYTNSSGYENTLYFANWAIYGAQYQPQSLPASSVTRIHYAFADIDSEGNVVSSDTYADLEKHYTTDSWSDNGTNAYGCVKQLYILKKQNRNMKVLLSVGGWTWSSKFSPMAADPTMRQNFASSAVQLVTDWGFDGIDIDWEFNAYTPTAEDTQNIVLLLQAVRNAFNAWSALHAPRYHFLITVASPAGPAVYSLWDIPAMDPYVDTWSLMAYDYAGAWSNVTGHASNIYFDAEDMPATPYSTDQAVSAYIAAGVKPSKIVMGLPLYGRSFEGTAGLGEPFDGVGTGDDLGSGQWRFRDLPRPGANEFYDPIAKASYSYDDATQELISYDTMQSVGEKSAYLKRKGLGGAMFWEASDDKNGTESLVVAMAGRLGRLDAARNLLHYPTSQYDNIRNGMPGS